MIQIRRSFIISTKPFGIIRETYVFVYFRIDFPIYRITIITFVSLIEGGNLAASKIRNLECPSYEICLIDYGCGKFNRKIHIMEQYP